MLPTDRLVEVFPKFRFQRPQGHILSVFSGVNLVAHTTAGQVACAMALQQGLLDADYRTQNAPNVGDLSPGDGGRTVSGAG